MVFYPVTTLRKYPGCTSFSGIFQLIRLSRSLRINLLKLSYETFLTKIFKNLLTRVFSFLHYFLLIYEECLSVLFSVIFSLKKGSTQSFRSRGVGENVASNLKYDAILSTIFEKVLRTAGLGSFENARLFF